MEIQGKFCDAIATLVILMVAKALTGLRVSHEEEIAGLDSSQHREKAHNPY
jgi:ammonia channel protein AmtB